MATVDDAIYTRATTHAGLSALISTRCYPVHLPPAPTYPAITYQRVSGNRVQAMGANPGVVESRYSIAAWATTVLEARDVIEQVRAAFERWRGTVAGVVVQDTLGPIWDQPFYSDDPDVYQWAMDFLVWYDE